VSIVLYHPRISTIGGARRECSRECSVASVSSVIPFTPRRRAKSTKSSQRSAGMDLRAFQDETVDAVVPQCSATSLVPPSASMIASQPVNIPQNILRAVRNVKHSTKCEMQVPLKPGKIGDMADELRIMARRLLRTRQALGLSQTEFCHQIGVERNVHNPFEKGRRPITLAVARKIRRRFGISLDWIIEGDPSRLPVELYGLLAEAA
jgi:ribosome-binding protein aMBF1 (putative translation factor)